MIQYIENAKNEFNACKKTLVSNDWTHVEKAIYRKYIFQGIESDLKTFNYSDLIEKYCSYFSALNIPKKVIKKGELFYRGRIGCMSLRGSIDDCNQTFAIPYHKRDIFSAPPLHSSGGRFNRDGVSFLYLASDKETCLSEIHAQVGQRCSIAEFICKDDIELLDISAEPDNAELIIWYEVLTQPIYPEIKYRYHITQFISEVLSKLHPTGIFYKSTQATGSNIVCYRPDCFALVEYSERIYVTTSIKYEFTQDPEDAIVKYSKREDYLQISSCNTDDENATDNNMDYMLQWIKYRKSNP